MSISHLLAPLVAIVIVIALGLPASAAEVTDLKEHLPPPVLPIPTTKPATAPTTAPNATAPATAPTTAPADELTAHHVVLALVVIAIGVGVAGALGVFRRRSIEGPPRLIRDTRARPLFLVTLIGGGIWLFSQIAYVQVRAAQFYRSNPPETQFGADRFTPIDFAVISTVPFVMGLIALVAGDAMIRPRMTERIGYDAPRLPRGLLWGALAMLVVYPLMFGGGIVLEAFYRLVQFKHPPAHELLSAMETVPSLARLALIFGACVAAPLFEEMLFRGHIQTLLTRFFSPPITAQGFPVAPAEPADPIESGQPAAAAAGAAAPSVPAAFAEIGTPQGMNVAAWTSVLVTSFIFAAVHPSWTAPLIFLLSVCIGYTYERTGNLWAAIAIHAIFNAASTLVFLNV